MGGGRISAADADWTRLDAGQSPGETRGVVSWWPVGQEYKTKLPRGQKFPLGKTPTEKKLRSGQNKFR